MTPEERFINGTWYVLRKIKKGSLYAQKGSPIEYIVNSVGHRDRGAPLEKDEVAILEKLQELQVIQIKDKQEAGSSYNPDGHFFYLWLVQSKFDELYALVEGGINEGVESGVLLRLINLSFPIRQDAVKKETAPTDLPISTFDLEKAKIMGEMPFEYLPPVNRCLREIFEYTKEWPIRVKQGMPMLLLHCTETERKELTERTKLNIFSFRAYIEKAGIVDIRSCSHDVFVEEFRNKPETPYSRYFFEKAMSLERAHTLPFRFSGNGEEFNFYIWAIKIIDAEKINKLYQLLEKTKSIIPHTNIFNLEKEKAKITAIKFEQDFQTARAKWLIVKSILDAIHKKLPPLEGADGIVRETINLNNGSLTPEQEKMLPFVLMHAYDNEAVSFPTEDSSVVISSEPINRFIEGEGILIEDLSKFEDYKAQIDDLCAFIEQREKNKFTSTINAISATQFIKDIKTVIEVEKSLDKKIEENGLDFRDKDKSALESQRDKRQSGRQNRLNFYPTTGDIEYKNEMGIVKSGNKDYALLFLLHKNKNTPFNAEDIQKHCNPSVNKSAHKFKKEKDIDDTVRQIRFKLRVKKGAFFPIMKRGEKGKKLWLWIEK